MDSLNSYAERIRPTLDALALSYVDPQVEAFLLAQATAVGISQTDAERQLLLLCLQMGIAVERFLGKDFRQRVRAALGDRFLDGRERELLERQGLELFAQAPDPQGAAQKILAEEVAAAGAWSERELRQALELRLKARPALSRRDWETIQEEITRKAATQGVDVKENELGEIYDLVLSDLHIKVRNGSVPLAMFGWTALVAVLVYFFCRLAFS